MADTNIYEPDDELPQAKTNVPFGSFLPSLGTGLLNWGLNQISAKSQRDWQEMMMNKANAYNSPLAQANRMRAAGLNPYQDMDAVPSASAGTGAQGAPANIQDPLSSALTLAHIRNMDAQTGKTLTETDKILQEISNLELLYQKGFIEKEEFEFRFNKLKDAWNDKSQYQADVEKTEAEAANQLAQANESQSRADKADAERLFTEALTATENALRDARVQTEKARATAENASATANVAAANKLIQEGKIVKLQADREAFTRSAETFFGFNFTGLDSELVAELMYYYSDVYSGKLDPKVALQRAKNDIQSYIDKDLYVPKTDSFSVGSSTVWGILSGDYSESHSGSVSVRRGTYGGGGSTW